MADIVRSDKTGSPCNQAHDAAGGGDGGVVRPHEYCFGYGASKAQVRQKKLTGGGTCSSHGWHGWVTVRKKGWCRHNGCQTDVCARQNATQWHGLWVGKRCGTVAVRGSRHAVSVKLSPFSFRLSGFVRRAGSLTNTGWTGTRIVWQVDS